jgi:hypothetical protein
MDGIINSPSREEGKGVRLGRGLFTDTVIQTGTSWGYGRVHMALLSIAVR